MKSRRAFGFPLRVILLIDLLMLLAVPALLTIEGSAHTPMAPYGVELPELDGDAFRLSYWDMDSRVPVVVGSDGSTRIRDKVLTGEALLAGLLMRADPHRDEDGDSRLCVELVAHRDVSYRHVAALMRILREPPLKIVLGEVRFLPRGAWGYSRGIPLLMTAPPEGHRFTLTVRAPPEARWEDVLAAIAAKIRAEVPGCARWMAGLAQLLYQSPECSDALPPDQRTEIGLLCEAFRIDPDDALARARLIDAMSWQFDCSLHELPSGVLYSGNGATAEQCRMLRSELEKFEALVAAHGTSGDHAKRVAGCRLHNRAYEAWLARRAEFDSYADYLSESGQD